MSRDTYSTYEAKARFSEILRKVREGQVVVVTYRGEPVAEVRPIGGAPAGLEDRLRRLADRGVLHRVKPVPGALSTSARRPGALERFLQERE
ncbi:MAG: type II toxin-antitoxin system prevent-host-death family antitoxin [Armatimonadetes bacterium]|nr:type II toxin-antitoxin system prevent-host-death family antitoxin [Armatimonadota bacterium]